jgi:hypothetical protein
MSLNLSPTKTNNKQTKPKALKEFVCSQLALQEMLKEIPLREMT